ncbi:hypothetical protein O6P43_005254 [Quillaja saponaria]|uniref:Uncharacterized protein n=1 Tax=Quillaja saponaria TaxID=32244 RepID=A0AAD7Q5S7_QUISA|nr:hypothetical protein O6P43_005254 [Quillaja saponaria]
MGIPLNQEQGIPLFCDPNTQGCIGEYTGGVVTCGGFLEVLEGGVASGCLDMPEGSGSVIGEFTGGATDGGLIGGFTGGSILDVLEGGVSGGVGRVSGGDVNGQLMSGSLVVNPRLHALPVVPTALSNTAKGGMSSVVVVSMDVATLSIDSERLPKPTSGVQIRS